MPRRAIPAQLERLVRAEAGNRCGYCLSPQYLLMTRLEIEHIVPLAKGGGNDPSNLWLACPLCNAHKSDRTTAIDPETGLVTPLFDPRRHAWPEHFVWLDGGLRIAGLTPIGRATVEALCLGSDPDALVVRGYWIAAGWHPPEE